MNAPVEKRVRPVVLWTVAVLVVVAGLVIAYKFVSRGSDTPSETEVVSPAAQDAPAAASNPLPAPAQKRAPSQPTSPLEEKWGIQVASLSMTPDGAALDLRYWVTDAEKAVQLATGSDIPYLIDQTSGAAVGMPSAPADKGLKAHSRARMMRQRGAFPPPPDRLAAGRTNSILLPNPGGVIKRGGKVSVVLGDLRTDDVMVQ